MLREIEIYTYQRAAHARATVYAGLPAFADPIPSAEEFISGITHKNSNPVNRGQMWDVLRAMHSRKMHYFPRLKDDMSDQALRFNLAFPDLSPDSGGTQPLGEDGWQRLYEAFKLSRPADYVKHILTLHDGEVRMVGSGDWELLPASGGTFRRACFWHYQFASKVIVIKPRCHGCDC